MTFNLQEAQSISEIPACRGPEVLALLIEVNPIQDPELQRYRARVSKFCSYFIIRKIMGDITVPFVEAAVEKASEPESLNFIGIARSRFHGLAGRRTADCFGARELRMSEGAHFSNEATEEIVESQGVEFKLPQKRNLDKLPDIYHDLFLRYQRSWKEHRGAQRKNASSINRWFHSPAFWDC